MASEAEAPAWVGGMLAGLTLVTTIVAGVVTRIHRRVDREVDGMKAEQADERKKNSDGRAALWKETKDIRRQLGAFEVETAKTLATKDDLKQGLEGMETRLMRAIEGRRA